MGKRFVKKASARTVKYVVDEMKRSSDDVAVAELGAVAETFSLNMLWLIEQNAGRVAAEAVCKSLLESLNKHYGEN